MRLTYAPKSCFGEQRTQLLNRTKVCLNVLNLPWDLTGLRFLMAMSCGALVVTESLYEPAPYRPGVHLAEAPLDKLADAVAYYVHHENERAALAESGYRFATEQLTLEQSLTKIMEIIREHPAVSPASL